MQHKHKYCIGPASSVFMLQVLIT